MIGVSELLERPNLQEDKIQACLEKSYGLVVSSIQFLRVGNDSSAWAFRVDTTGGSPFFLKVKKGLVDPPGVLIPSYLHSQGIKQVVAAVPTLERCYWQPLEGYNLILYPFIEGKMGMEIGLTDEQWIEYGRILRMLHAMILQDNLASLLVKEAFIPKWSRIVREIQRRIEIKQFSDPYQRELAAFLSSKQEEIKMITLRAEELGAVLQKRSLHNVLCHADIHTANLLITKDQEMFVVDWDGVLLAPKERDLMFVVEAAVGGFSVRLKEENLFFEGYGKTGIDPLALAYYRYEWVVQDIGDYGERVFLMQELGDETKEASVLGLMSMFQPGDVVESAYRTDDQFL
jgi:spectinomycin phosphotransferase